MSYCFVLRKTCHAIADWNDAHDAEVGVWRTVETLVKGIYTWWVKHRHMTGDILVAVYSKLKVLLTSQVLFLQWEGSPPGLQNQSI